MSFGCGFCCYGYTVTVVWDHSLPFYDNGLFLDSMFTRAFGLVWFSVQFRLQYSSFFSSVLTYFFFRRHHHHHHHHENISYVTYVFTCVFIGRPPS